MKKIKEIFSVLIWVMICILFFILLEYNNGGSEKIIKQRIEIKKLTEQINQLRKKEHYSIRVNASTFKVTTKLNIKNQPYEYTQEKPLKPGKNIFYFVLTERVAIEATITKY